jgi:hypothetical protein
MFKTMEKNAVCEEILGARGDLVHYAIRVKIVPYPEDVYAVWVIIGVRYLEV